MRKAWWAAAVPLVVFAPALAGAIEDRLEESWRGAWVVLHAESRSDCDNGFTNNRINGRLSAGNGRFWFEPGELAKIENLKVHRSRIDVLLSIDEPLRVAWQDGPFTLYSRVSCRIELEIEVPRELVRNRDAARIDSYLAKVLEPYETLEAATEAATWNGREVEPFPADYEITLAEHAIWKAEQHNAKVDARIAQAHDQLDALSNAVHEEDEYVAGLAAGISAQRARRHSSCEQLLNARFTPASPPKRANGEEGAVNRSTVWLRGYKDGQSLVHYLAVLTRAGNCYVPIPPHPEAEAARHAPESSPADRSAN